MSLTNDNSIDQPGSIAKHTRRVGAGAWCVQSKFYDLREAPKNDQIGELVSFPQLPKICKHISSIFNVIHVQTEL